MLLRYQVLLTLLALGILGLGAGQVNICSERAVIQQVVEGIQIVRLRFGKKQRKQKGSKEHGENRGEKGNRTDQIRFYKLSLL